MDLDVECLKPLQDLTVQHNCILSQEPIVHSHFLTPVKGPLVSNSFMACQPNHGFLKRFLMDNLGWYSGWIFWNDIMHATGPNFMTSVYGKFENYGGPRDLLSAPPTYFFPTVDKSRIEKIKYRCKKQDYGTFFSEDYFKTQKDICENMLSDRFVNKPTKDSYTDHHWTHSWAGPNNDPYGLLKSEFYFDLRKFLKKFNYIN